MELNEARTRHEGSSHDSWTAGARILGRLQQVATNDRQLELREIHRETLLAIAEHLFHVSDFDPDEERPPIESARELAGYPKIRQQIMNMAGILPFLEEEHQGMNIHTYETGRSPKASPCSG